MSNPGLRGALAGYADPVLSPILPKKTSLVLTVMGLGTASILMNTILRHLFIDPITQAHMAHRQGQMRKMLQRAQMARDHPRVEQAREIQQKIMPEQLEMQAAAMRPMLFTFVLIIAIFSWAADVVENYRVDYVSLPWTTEWNLEDRFLLFPAWICLYIVMSAPLGRVVDRHLKLIRLKNHPVVVKGVPLAEPILATLSPDLEGPRRRSSSTGRRRSNAGRKRKVSKADPPAQKSPTAELIADASCPKCNAKRVHRIDRKRRVCEICIHAWGS